MSIRIGCGSWSDPAYAGLVFPPSLSPELRLCGYAMWFDHIEVNSTFYGIPRKETVENWVALTPPSFLFDLKLHMAFSRSPVKAAEGPLLGRLLENVQPLLNAKRLGVFLLVLPPTFAPGRHRLEELDALIEKLRPYLLAVELRHVGWVDGSARETTLAFFRERRLIWVAVDMPRIVGSDLMPVVDEVTNMDLAYLRLHGRNPGYLTAKSAADKHNYAYSEEELDELTTRIRGLSAQAKNLRVVANNHACDYAPMTAFGLMQRLDLFP